MRFLSIHMTVLQTPGSNGDYYFTFLFVNDLDIYQQLFNHSIHSLSYQTPGPKLKPSFAEVTGEKDPIDLIVLTWR